MIDFNWTVYQQNIAILGMQGGGKTTHAKKILDSIPNSPRLIVSPQNPQEHYGAYAEPISKVSDIENDSAMLWTGDFSKPTFERICQKLMATCSNLVLVVDDVHEFCTKQKMPDHFNRLIQSGRNRGICGVYISPAPNLVHNYILQSCHHVFAFAMNLQSQIEWLEKNYFGVDAQILIPQDKRSKQPSITDDFPKYSFLYRYHANTQNHIGHGQDF